MNVTCTIPSCLQLNYVADDILKPLINGSLMQELSCSNCGRPLILLNQYLPLEKIASTEFLIAFRALDLQSTGEKPAQRVIKQFSASKLLQPTQLAIINRLFKKEIDILNALQHPLIPHIYAYFELSVYSENDKYSQSANHQPNLFYLVEEYIAGKSLFIHKQNQIFSERQILEILEQLLILIKLIHRHRIIHRNINPFNIIGGEDRQVYLINFGAISQILQIVEQEKPHTETVIMTPGYSAPEQENLKIVNFSSDLYSLAATCVYLLTGENPIQWNIPHNLDEWKKHTKVNKNLAAILDRMLDAYPHRRYQSADEVIKAFSDTGLIRFHGLKDNKKSHPIAQSIKRIFTN